MKKQRVKRWLKDFCSTVKENKGLAILMGVMTIFNAMLAIASLLDRGVSSHGYEAIWSIILLLVLTVVVGLVFYRAKRRNWPIEKIFLVVGLLVGFLYIFIVPMNAQQDEGGHFLRTWEIAEGNLLSKGGEGTQAPQGVWEAISRQEEDSYHEYIRVYKKTGIMAGDEYADIPNYNDGYSPFSYIPQIVAIWLGKIVNLPVIPIMYIGRLFNMFCCVFVLYLCIKYIPFLKKMVFFIAMLPMSMNNFASLSADGSMICAGIALITFVLYARETMKKKLTYNHFLLLLLICVVLVMTKPIYAFMCLMVFWIPRERFKSKKHKYLFIGALGAITLWMVILRMWLTPMNVDEYGMREIYTQMMLQQPHQALWIVFRTIIEWPWMYLGMMFGNSLEWFTADVYEPYTIVMLGLMTLLMFERDGRASKSLRIFSIVSSLIMVIVIFLSELMIWTDANSKFITGVQGRYFLPFLLLIPLALLPSVKKRKLKIVRPAYLYLIMTLVNVSAMTIIFGVHI